MPGCLVCDVQVTGLFAISVFWDGASGRMLRAFQAAFRSVFGQFSGRVFYKGYLITTLKTHSKTFERIWADFMKDFCEDSIGKSVYKNQEIITPIASRSLQNFAKPFQSHWKAKMSDPVSRCSGLRGGLGEVFNMFFRQLSVNVLDEFSETNVKHKFETHQKQVQNRWKGQINHPVSNYWGALG